VESSGKAVLKGKRLTSFDTVQARVEPVSIATLQDDGRETATETLLIRAEIDLLLSLNFRFR